MPAVNAHIYTLKWDVKAQVGPTTLTITWGEFERPALGDLTDEVYASVEPLDPQAELTAFSLYIYVGAIVSMYQQAADYGRDSNGRPGWSVLMDIDTCPDEALPWLAQFVGVDITGLDPADARAKMIDQPNRRRGTPGRLSEAIADTLTGTRTVTILERNNGTGVDAPFEITVLTNPTETPNRALTVSVAEQEKFATLILYMHGLRQAWARVKTDNATWQIVKNTYATWNDVKKWNV